MSRKRLEIKEGERYGRLTVIKEVEPHIFKNGKQRRKFLCQCDCGSDPIKVFLNGLTSGRTTSCGCRQREEAAKVGKSATKENLFFINDETKVVTGYDSNGKEFYFDKEFLNKVKKYCWHVDKNGYVSTKKKSSKKILKMHRLITNCPENMVVDHINHNKADNRMSNLRICEWADNTRNRKAPKNSKTGITGVTWHKHSSKWQARITINGKRINLGVFDNIEDARQARLKAELEYFGEFSINYEEIKSLKNLK